MQFDGRSRDDVDVALDLIEEVRELARRRRLVRKGALDGYVIARGAERETCRTTAKSQNPAKPTLTSSPGRRFFPFRVKALGRLLAARRKFLDGPVHRLASFTCALLNPPDQLFMFAFGVLKIVIRELGPLLFQLAFDDVPIALDFECRHSCLSFVRFGNSPPT